MKTAAAEPRFIGAKPGFCGGKIKQIASLAVHADIDNMEIAEDLHMIIAHYVKNIIITEFKADTPHHHAERQLTLAAARMASPRERSECPDATAHSQLI